MRSHCIFALLILLFLVSLVFSGSSTHLHSLGALFLDAVHLCSFTVTSYANPLNHDPFPETPVEPASCSQLHAPDSHHSSQFMLYMSSVSWERLCTSGWICILRPLSRSGHSSVSKALKKKINILITQILKGGEKFLFIHCRVEVIDLLFMFWQMWKGFDCCVFCDEKCPNCLRTLKSSANDFSENWVKSTEKNCKQQRCLTYLDN